jgi:hypothetical protein
MVSRQPLVNTHVKCCVFEFPALVATAVRLVVVVFRMPWWCNAEWSTDPGRDDRASRLTSVMIIINVGDAIVDSCLRL